MELLLTKHAEERLAERNILPADLKAAFQNKVRTTAGEPGTVWVHGYAGGRILKVCVPAVDVLSDQVVVITAAWEGNNG